MKKIKKYIIAIMITLIVCGVGYLHFAPVDFDAGSCSGGYGRWVVDKYTTDLIDTFIYKQGYDKGIKYNLISKPEEIASTISWKGRTLKANIKIEIDNKVYDVNFSGKRYWVEKFNWKVDSVV